MDAQHPPSKAGSLFTALFTAAGVVIFGAPYLDLAAGTTFNSHVPWALRVMSPYVLAAAIGMVLARRWSHRVREDCDPVPGARQVFAVCFWFGLVAGLAELLTELGRTALYGFKNPPLIDPYAFHVIPVPALGLFGVLGLVAALFPLVSRRPAPGQAIAWAYFCATLAFVAPFWRFMPTLRGPDSWLLALGLAFVAIRAISNRPAGFFRLVRRTTLLPLIALAVVWIAVYVPKAMRSDPAMEIAPPANAPNVLLLVLDTVRADALSSYRNEHQRPTTPNLDRFAERGVRFEWALSTAPWTLPSHAAMFTGRHTHEVFRSDETPLNGSVPVRDEFPTLAEVLSSRGYATGGFVGNKSYCSYIRGIDRGFFHYSDYRLSPGEILSSSAMGVFALGLYQLWKPNPYTFPRKSARVITEAFLHWLDQSGERPFFAFLNFFDAHSPYVLPEPIDVAFRTARTSCPTRGSTTPTPQSSSTRCTPPTTSAWPTSTRASASCSRSWSGAACSTTRSSS